MSEKNNRIKDAERPPPAIRFEVSPPPHDLTLRMPYGFDHGIGWEDGARYTVRKVDEWVFELVREEP